MLSQLGLAEQGESLRAGWDEAQVSRPKAMAFLAPAFVRSACAAACLPDAPAREVLAAAEAVSRSEALRALAWYCHARLFLHSTPKPELRRWPLPSHALGERAGMFYVLILLSGTPQMQEIHRRHNIPPQVVRDTVLDLKLCLESEDYFKQYGHRGISTRILGWLLNHWRGELYRLGRLQFIPSRFQGKLRAFRRKDGIVVALSEAGVRYRGDGQVDGAGGVFDGEGGWTSSLELGADEAVGFPIDPSGRAVRRQVRLAKSEWRPVLTPGDPVLDMHIAAGAPMDYAQCGDSIRQALQFFPRHFPDVPFIALTCYSWILDSQFERLLPARSNLVRFQREVYLFPIPFSQRTTIATVFGSVPKDIKSAPRTTTMQRAFAEHLERGGHFHGGACFLMVEDFDWGRQPYRTNSPLLHLLGGLKGQI